MMDSKINIHSLITSEFRITAQIKNHRNNYLKSYIKPNDKGYHLTTHYNLNENEVDLYIYNDGTFGIQDRQTRENLTFEGLSVSWRAPNGQLNQRFELHQTQNPNLPHGIFCLGTKTYLSVDLVSFLNIETLESKPVLGEWESFHVIISNNMKDKKE